VKIEKFLTCVLTELAYYPDINLRTLKIMMDKFRKCLSKREKERWQLSLDMINLLTTKQKSIIEINNDIKTSNLETDLIKLKKLDE